MTAKLTEETLAEVLKDGPKSNKEIRKALSIEAPAYDPKLDRALQKLRKEGKVKVVNGKWTVDDFKLCEHCEGRGWLKKGAK